MPWLHVIVYELPLCSLVDIFDFIISLLHSYVMLSVFYLQFIYGVYILFFIGLIYYFNLVEFANRSSIN